MKITKRALSIVLSLCLLLMLSPLSVMAAEGDEAAVTIGGVTTTYATLAEAFLAVEDCTAEDQAVVQVLQDIYELTEKLSIDGGVFSLDLNGKWIRSSKEIILALRNDADVTIMDSGTGGKISTGESGAAVWTTGTSNLTIKGGIFETHFGDDVAFQSTGSLFIDDGTFISRRGDCVSCSYATEVIINGGDFTGYYVALDFGLFANTDNLPNFPVTINGGTFTQTNYVVGYTAITVVIEQCAVLTINGGTFTTRRTVLFTRSERVEDHHIILNGGHFPGGITFSDWCPAEEECTLQYLLGEGKAYWAGDTMLNVEDLGHKITDKGEIVIKDACDHQDGEKTDYVNNGDNHVFTYSCCGYANSEEHVYANDEDMDCDSCGASRHTLRFSGNSVSEDVNGLAFRFDVEVDGLTIKEGTRTEADYTNATLNGYKLLSMGAIANNGVSSVDIPCVYLCDWEEDSAAFAVRIINIPEDKRDVFITVTPYQVVEIDGEAVTLYGTPQVASYNSVTQ